MKVKVIFLAFSLCSIAYSQVGVNTSTPKNTLHVNGGLQLTKDLNVGGNGNTLGSSGNSGDVLVSQGSGKSTKWIKATDITIGSGNPIFQKIAVNATRTNSTSYSTGTTNTVLYNSNRILGDYATYSNGSFTVK